MNGDDIEDAMLDIDPAQIPPLPPARPRCVWAVEYGETLATRCALRLDHDDNLHIANGLPQFPYQRVQWLRGDQREFESDRDDVHTWTR